MYVGSVVARVRRRAEETVYGGGPEQVRFDRPAGDPGLFGPGSMVWRVHGDLPGMFTGGLAALLLQTLHPLAMAGVDQHSSYRHDPVGRLNRTTAFIAVTSYGPRPEALAALAGIRRRHRFVQGTAPDGRPYAAGDPVLLTWVHAAQTSCFLAGHQMYGKRPLTAAQGDRYLCEMAVIAEHLGAPDVPKSAAALGSYFAAVRGELRATDAALATVAFLRGCGRDPLERVSLRILLNSAGGLLPLWAARQLGLDRSNRLTAAVDHSAAQVLGALLRHACEPFAIVDTAHTRARTRFAPCAADAGGPAEARTISPRLGPSGTGGGPARTLTPATRAAGAAGQATRPSHGEDA